MTREHELASMETMYQWVARPVVWLCVSTPNGSEPAIPAEFTRDAASMRECIEGHSRVKPVKASMTVPIG